MDHPSLIQRIQKNSSEGRQTQVIYIWHESNQSCNTHTKRI